MLDRRPLRLAAEIGTPQLDGGRQHVRWQPPPAWSVVGCRPCCLEIRTTDGHRTPARLGVEPLRHGIGDPLELGRLPAFLGPLGPLSLFPLPSFALLTGQSLP